MQLSSLSGMMYVLLLLCAATICFITDAQLHPIETQDLKRIVDSIKRDVDRHLKKTPGSLLIESRFDPPEPKSAVVENIDEFVEMIQDSMHHHLVKHFDQPSDANYGPTETEYESSTESITEQSSVNGEGASRIHEIRIGSSKGMPGVHFPDYSDIPITPFTCSDKAYLPGFYADLDTDCQVFHVCWPDRRESFLCPLGTIFNQALKVCDYWYSSNCSLTPYYYSVNAELAPDSSKSKTESTSSMISTLLDKTDQEHNFTKGQPSADSVISFISQFMPIKAKVVVYPESEKEQSKIVASASIGENKSHSKSRLRQRKRGSSKKSRVRKAVDDNSNDGLGCTGDNFGCLNYFMRELINPFIMMDEPYAEVLQFRFSEALDRTLADIETNSTLSALYGDVEKLIDSIKYWLVKQDLPESLDLEPGSELYEYDIRVRQSIEDMRERGNVFLMILASTIYNFDQIKPIIPDIINEIYPDYEPSPLTRIDPRNRVDPAADETSRLQNDESSLNVRVKRSATILHPLKFKHKRRVHIYPRTKKSLLKSYVKFFKIKSA